MWWPSSSYIFFRFKLKHKFVYFLCSRYILIWKQKLKILEKVYNKRNTTIKCSIRNQKIMPYCCVPGCGNNSSNCNRENLTFHRLPFVNQELLKAWTDNLNLKKTYLPDHYRVCSDHFDSQCFRQSAWASKRCIVPGSIPNKFVSQGKTDVN